MRYLEEFAEKKSLSDDKDHLRKLDPYLRSLRLDAIDMTVLKPFIVERKSKDGVSNATVNRALEVVRRILNVAHQDWRRLPAIPRIRMLREPRRRARFLRHEEANRLIDAMPVHMKPIVRFALDRLPRGGDPWARMESCRSQSQGGMARPRYDQVRRGSRDPTQCGRRGGARVGVGAAEPWSAP